jgi:predicted nucleotidyltransferase
MRQKMTAAERARPKKARPAWRVARAAINELAKQIVQRFGPHRIILFGSYAYGQPTPDSDVDLLVVMPAKNETTQAARIRLAIDCDFPLALLVRTPATLRWRLREGDWFLREIVARGIVLYEETHRRAAAKG